MDREERGDIVRYHLSFEETNFLRRKGYAQIIIWHEDAPNRGRIVGTDKDTLTGRNNQRLIERLMLDGGFIIRIKGAPKS